MKKTLALIMSIAACCAAFAGCASKDDVDSNPSSRNDTAVTSDSSAWYRDNMDSSKTFPDRVESTVDDLVSGGERIINDTVSTADDVVDNMTK